METAGDTEKGVLRSDWIGPEPEEGLLRAGLLQLAEAIGTERLLEFPRRANGTPLLTRQGFFERLLKGETSLLDCAAADASAAEADVKRLGLHQLLAIRCKNLDLGQSAAGRQGAKASFLSLVDRCTTSLLGQRLLGAELEALSDAHRALLLRHIVLIYGASRTLAATGSGHWDGSVADWWLLAVGGTRRYLQLSACQVQSKPPGVPVCCYRSYTAPKPQDPKRSRIFRWQVLLVQNPASWIEDPLATEQRSRQRRSLTDAKASGSPGAAKAAGPKSEKADALSSGFELFGDFDVEALFDDLDGDEAYRPTSGAPGGASVLDADSSIDDFFDSLLDDSFSDLKTGAAPQMAALASKEPATSVVREIETATANGPSESGYHPTKSMRNEARLRLALTKFYASRKTDKLSNLDRIVERYAEGRVVELWAQLGVKYALPPATAVQWLASTLDSRIAVQWDCHEVPSTAQRVLDELSGDVGEVEKSSALRASMEDGDSVTAAAVAFRHGSSRTERPALWRALLGSGTVEDEPTLRERRGAYRELRSRMLTDLEAPAVEQQETTPSSSSSSWLKDWRKEVEDDLRSAWPEETFSRTEAARAAVLVALTYSWRVSRCVKGACEIAGLLVFALSSGMQRAQLEDGEADAFWCLSQLLADAQETILGDDALAAQARRLLILHRCFDYPVAKLLEDHGLVAMPALRLGALLLCRAGFSLLQAARLWDSILADPRRFQFADNIVIALLLLRRGDLLQRDDVGGLAESLVTAPQTLDFDTILSTAYAVCAFQRRHGPDSGAPYPPRSSVHSAEGALDLDSAVNAAQEGLSSLWGKARELAARMSPEFAKRAATVQLQVRAAGAGYWEAAQGSL
ncbi:TBC1D13 [Symbiodinium sp. CCMP2592]|nr:TBC1D13 [Symbiodinium sp. CCMP2592]